MVGGLVDTVLLVDLLRQHAPALAWFEQQPALGLAHPTMMEVLGGARDKKAQEQAQALVTKFELVYLTEADQEWAARQLLAYRLSHGVGILDCLIAAPSHRLQIPLYTHNLKHFSPLLGTLASAPY